MHHLPRFQKLTLFILGRAVVFQRICQLNKDCITGDNMGADSKRHFGISYTVHSECHPWGKANLFHRSEKHF
jgi:hypothetical protein